MTTGRWRNAHPSQRALLELSDERDAWLRRIRDSWHEGFAAAEAVHASDYDRGYADALADIKGIEHGIVRAIRKYQTQWVVRGQDRTRQTFARPHPADYPGQQAAKAAANG